MDDTNRIIHIIIKDKNGIILEDDVHALSSYNEIGIFDVLPLHTNFISLVREKLTLHKEGGNRAAGPSGPEARRDMEIGFGLVKVFQNNVHIYLGLPNPDEETEAKPPIMINK